MRDARSAEGKEGNKKGSVTDKAGRLVLPHLLSLEEIKTVLFNADRFYLVSSQTSIFSLL